MPRFDLVDETFVVAAPAAVAAAVGDPDRWRRWWPDLRLSIFQDRAEHGIRWNLGGALAGSMEVWLEPFGDGVIVHYYLRADPPPGRTFSAGTVRRERRRRALRAKQVFWSLKDELEAGRPAGEPNPGERADSADSADSGNCSQPRVAPSR
ncbi:MAG TPA: polyketide cyclase / dehydrase and lipid transport [Mycobacteriales bacterium]|nr:polyketide cyclase / dehydrase and lipid transport [Mycobacteriales bacterium]